MYLLDTNVISELRKLGDGRADANVTAWLANRDANSFFISVITVMELEIGILRVERRDQRQASLLRHWLDSIVRPEFSDRTLPIDDAIALRCARLHVPDPRSDRDALIAATALHHGMSVVTRNVADFAATTVPLINPWG
ncbi:twitching motility protein PilT [alpha proteobacterium AAP38]|nr:twitching motility protein PilT [alpha proteobacterium AAP38]